MTSLAHFQTASLASSFVDVDSARKTRSIGIAHRVSNALFGSPSACRAHGARRASLLQGVDGGFRFAKKKEVPVYAVDVPRGGGAAQLPRVWISEPVRDVDTGVILRRDFVASYPCDDDAAGKRAYEYGCAYFAEALTYSSSSDASSRSECFQAAELLFLHAASRGCMKAYVKLGILYADDLCEGVYWAQRDLFAEDLLLALSARAVDCFSRAAASGDAEACRRLGEMVALGRGCRADERHAFDLLMRAFELATLADDPAQCGHAALCIAQAYEAGAGCEHSFRRAYAWYRIAEEELAYVVEEGGWYFKRPRAKAVLGARRMRQELLGGY